MIFDNYINKFTSNVLPVKREVRGIFLSEGFMFCAIADNCNVQLIIESGTKHGGSSTIFRKYGFEVITIDRNKNLNIVHLLEIGIISVIGNSRIVLIKLVEFCTSLNVGILIDGPKDCVAIEMAEKIFKKDNVKMLAIHDQKSKEMDKTFQDVVYADNEKFYKKYGHLDDKAKEKYTDFDKNTGMGVIIK